MNTTPELQFDPTTTFGDWDPIAKQYENNTEKILFDLEKFTAQEAAFHLEWNASPTPISGDMLACYKALKRAGKFPKNWK